MRAFSLFLGALGWILAVERPVVSGRLVRTLLTWSALRGGGEEGRQGVGGPFTSGERDSVSLFDSETGFVPEVDGTPAPRFSEVSWRRSLLTQGEGALPAVLVTLTPPPRGTAL